MKNAGPIEEISGEASRARSGATIRDCIPFADGTREAGLARVDGAVRGPQDGLALRMEAAVEAFYDWQGGLVWLRMEGEPEAELLRRLIRKLWRRPCDAGARVARPARAAVAGVRAAAAGPCRAVGAAEGGSTRQSSTAAWSSAFSMPGAQWPRPECSYAMQYAEFIRANQFHPAQLADPHVAESEKILRKCVHCGFCTATCPTYVTLGNELDSARAGAST